MKSRNPKPDVRAHNEALAQASGAPEDRKLQQEVARFQVVRTPTLRGGEPLRPPGLADPLMVEVEESLRSRNAKAADDLARNCPDPFSTLLVKRSHRACEKQVGGDHYCTMKVDTWGVIEDCCSYWEVIGYYRGNQLKYLMRAGRKGDKLEDLKKAAHYAEQMKSYMDRHQPPDSVAETSGKC